MKTTLRNILLAAVLLLGATNVMAVEEAPYTVVKQEGRFELRDYAPQIVAEVVVDGTLEEAGNKAFRPLFAYISGANRAQAKVAMTAPVAQEAVGEKIAMTAPVGQQLLGGRWVISFMMPAGSTLESLPVPDDPNVTLRQIPARRLAAVRYSGTWSEKRYQQYKAELEGWMRQQGLTAAGEALWARYNPPFTFWFLRRNEILIPIAAVVELKPAE